MTAKVKPVPEGYHTVTPYLIIQDAAKAIEFYKSALGAQERFTMPDPEGRVMHGEIQIGDSVVMMSDEYPQMGARSPKSLGGTPVNIFLYVDDVDTWFERAVAAGCQAEQPPTDMFWGDRFAKFSDPFGHSWSMATHKEDVSPEEMGRRAAEAMGAQ